jgi:hypothetical protein
MAEMQQVVCLISIFNHIVGQASNVCVNLAKGAPVRVLRVVDANDEALGAPHHDDTLAALAIFFATSLDEWHGAFLIVDLTASERILGACDGEAGAHDRVEACPAEKSGQLDSLLLQNLISGRRGPG